MALGTIAIFDADAPPALAFLRSLGRAGVRTCIYGPRALPVARFSRFAADYRRCPDPEDSDAFLRWLEARVRDGDITCIAPTSDLLAFYISEVLHLLPARVQAALPSREAMLDALFKERLHEICARLGQVTPKTVSPRSLDEAMEMARGLEWPLVIKPKSHVGVGLARGVVVHERDDLRRHFVAYDFPVRGRTVLDRYPGLRWPLLQEYIPNALGNLFSVTGLLGAGGEPLAYSATRKVSQWPPQLGVGTLFEPYVDEGPPRRGVEIARGILGRGIFELELVFDERTERHVAIDLNPRAYGQIALDIARGHDLPLLWYQLAHGRDPAPVGDAATDVRWVHSIPYHVGHLVGLLRGPQRRTRLRRWAGGLRGAWVDVVNDAADPLPSVAFTARMLRHPGGLLRPFFETSRR